MFPTKYAFTRFNRLLNKREHNLVTTSRKKNLIFFPKSNPFSGRRRFCPPLNGSCRVSYQGTIGRKRNEGGKGKKLEELIHQEKGEIGFFSFSSWAAPKERKKGRFLSQGRFTVLRFPEFRSDFFASFVVALKS